MSRLKDVDAALSRHEDNFSDLVDENYLMDNFNSYIKIKGMLSIIT